ncbi:MAG: hypothetical protein HY721_07545 [Planctomycetes bacterium]|nr:hypothetical protein [Planctomycetota bacterium]
MSSKFWLEAESASGAPGDVVGVTFSLHYAPGFDFELNTIDLAVCHDPSLAELAGEPVYSEEILARNPLVMYVVPVREDQDPRHSGYGFDAHFGIIVDRSPVVGELPLMTVFYRLLGFPWESAEISFCDGELLSWNRETCNFSGIDDTRIVPRAWPSPLLSTRNRNGTLTIRASTQTLPGDANFDGRFDVSDPISVLGYLFLGESEPRCLPAADYDGDGQLIISDPIRMLGVLFLGQPPPATTDRGLVSCR